MGASLRTVGRPSGTTIGTRGGRASRTWFRGAVDRFRFFNLAIHPFEDPTGAVGEVEAEGIIKSTGRVYRQNYVVFIRVTDGKIAFIREYFDPVRAAKAMDLRIAV